MFSKKLLFVFLIPLLLPFTSREAFAQETPFDVTVSPQYFTLSGQPGDILKEKFRVRNNAASSINLKIQIKNLSSDALGKAVILEPNLYDDTTKFIQLPVASFSAQPKEWTNVNFTITLPHTTNFGYDWVLLISQEDTKVLSEGVAAKLNGSVAIPVLLDVNKKNATVGGNILDFKTDASWYEYPPVTFLTEFENTGNIHIKPRGNIFITDWRGERVATLDINKDLGAVLPRARRQFATTWSDSFITWEDKTIDGTIVTDAHGKPIKNLKIRFDKILDMRIGRYTAHAFIVVSGPNKDYSYESTTTFIMFPWLVVTGTLIFVLFAGIGMFNTLKNIVRKIASLFKRSKKITTQ